MAPSASLDGDTLPSLIQHNDVTDSFPRDNAILTAATHSATPSSASPSDTPDYNINNNSDSHTKNQPSRDNCLPRRHQEQDKPRPFKMSTELVGKTVSPFLKEHIPGLYAPVGKEFQDGNDESAVLARNKDANTRYCYRHRPDSKCRRAADESKMGIIQRVSLTSFHLLYCFSKVSSVMLTSHPGPQQSSSRRSRSYHPRLVSILRRPI